MAVIKLIKLLNEENVRKMKESAQKLGFREIKLFKTIKSGFLGIFAIFDGNTKKEELNIRAQALHYPLTQILGCKLGIISNNFVTLEKEQSVDLEKPFLKESTLDPSFLAGFKKVFLSSPEEYEVEQADVHDLLYQHEIEIGKQFYEIVSGAENKSNSDKVQIVKIAR